RRDARIEVAEREARLRLSSLELRLQGSTAALRVLAHDQRLRRAFEQGAQSQLADLQQEYHSALPDVLRLALLPAGLNRPDLAAEPPIGYAVLDMLRRAE